MAKSKGRPIGSKTKPQIGNFITREQVEKLMVKAYEMAEEGNETMIKFLLEHVFGRPVQPIANPEGETFKISGLEITVRK